jgi:hypothetical protein
VSLVVLSRLDGDLPCWWPRSWVQVYRGRAPGADGVEGADELGRSPSAQSPFILGVATVLVDPGLTAIGAMT